jgi:ribosomal protein S18 acetylase RimI-like enzyme
MPPVLSHREDSIVIAPSDSQIRSVLDTDPVWAAYALGDLAPDYAPYSEWCLAAGRNGMGLILLFSRLSPPALFAMGDPEGVARAIEHYDDMPEAVYLLIQQAHYDTVSRYYQVPPKGLRNMWRMHLVDSVPAATAVSLPDDLRLRALELEDKDRMFRLYAHGGPYAPDAFDAYQVADGTFFGVTNAEGELLASGGTHVVNWDAGVAAIGNMYTHPDYRGLGLGQAVLRAIAGNLLSKGVDNIVLNVDDRNAGARRLYERNGFEVFCSYVEGIGRKQAIETTGAKG